MTTVRRVALIAVIVLILVAGWRFAHENEAIVSIDYVLGRTADVALWKALLMATATGVLIAGAYLGMALLRARLESRRYRKAMVNLESEVHQLRNLPVVASGAAISGTASSGRGAAAAPGADVAEGGAVASS